MKAEFSAVPKKAKGINVAYRDKQKVNAYAAIVKDGAGKMLELIKVEFYGTGQTSYCNLWVKYADDGRTGSGKAGGYGYHKPSAALAEAIAQAGITLDEAIDGQGDCAMTSALRAIAKAAGFEECLTVSL